MPPACVTPSATPSTARRAVAFLATLRPAAAQLAARALLLAALTGTVSVATAAAPTTASAQSSGTSTKDTTKQVDVRSQRPVFKGPTGGSPLPPTIGPPVITPGLCALTGAPGGLLASAASCRPCSLRFTEGNATLWQNAPSCVACPRPGLAAFWASGVTCGPKTLLATLAATGTGGMDAQADPAGSSNPVGAYPITLWTYDFGDGSPAVPSATSAPVVHTYAANGTYTVTLTVSNASGDIPGIATGSLIINGGPPCGVPASETRTSVCGAGWTSGSRFEQRDPNTGAPGPGVCPFNAWYETSNTCVAAVPCSANPSETRTSACGAGFVSGTRFERRDPDASAAGPGTCPFTAWYETSNTCVASVPCSADPSETRTVACGAGYVSGSRTEQRDANVGAAGPGTCPFNAWYETSNTCVAFTACTAGAPETRTVTCGAGFSSGNRFERRDANTAVAGPGACPFNAWYETSNTCVATVLCTAGASETQTLPCGPGFVSGTITQQRDADAAAPGPGVCPFTGWYQTSNTCVAATPCTMPADETRTVACGAGYTSGSRLEQRSGDAGAAGPGTCPFFPWSEISNTCVASAPCAAPGGPTTQTIACPVNFTGSGTIQTRSFDNAAAGPGFCPWFPWVDGATDCIPVCPAPLSETQTLSCAVNETGSGATQQRDKTAAPACGWGPWYDVIPGTCKIKSPCLLIDAPVVMRQDSPLCTPCTIPGKEAYWSGSPSCSSGPRAVTAVFSDGDRLTGAADGGCTGSGNTYTCSAVATAGIMCKIDPTNGQYTCGVFVSAGDATGGYCSAGFDAPCPTFTGPVTTTFPDTTEDLVLVGTPICIVGRSFGGGTVSTTENLGNFAQNICVGYITWVYK